MPWLFIRSNLKKVFWPNLFVGRSVQILEIPEYASGLNLAAASILNQNPIFEMASRSNLIEGLSGSIIAA